MPQIRQKPAAVRAWTRQYWARSRESTIPQRSRRHMRRDARHHRRGCGLDLGKFGGWMAVDNPERDNAHVALFQPRAQPTAQALTGATLIAAMAEIAANLAHELLPA
jgi:hypothetical protein